MHADRHKAPAPGAPPAGRPTAALRAIWAWARPLVGVGILVVLLWRLGTGPALAGLRLIDHRAVLAALVIGLVSTVCCAWRWTLVAGGLGVRLPLGTAVADCYRAVFLNATLPGGVLGDVHRAVRHGRDVGDLGRGVRTVLWERIAGQAVLLAMAAVVLATFPSPVRPVMAVVAAVLVAAGLGTALLVRALPRVRCTLPRVRRPLPRPRTGTRHPLPEAGRDLPRRWSSRWSRAVRTARDDIRAGLFARRNWLGVILASALAVTGHLATFLVAAYTVGSTAAPARLIPLTLLALLAMGLPTNIGGFGPREGVAAWAFSAAGLTAAQGVATALVYGALVLVASLPGAAVLLIRRLRAPGPAARPDAVGG